MALLEPIKQAMLSLYEEMVAADELPSVEQINTYLGNFRDKFSPERLSSLDGEELLETMHNSSDYKSLVYWLEFKNDDDFGARFGSIAGGSALKFGLFRRRETGEWTTGSPQKMKTVSVDEAIEIARKHRKQLLAGVKLLEAFPANGNDADYARLQAEMDRVAPDVSNTAWGHKYFSLLFADKLDDYHNPHYQRFYLIKLLQTPPPGDGRYTVAGRYVALAHELGMPINHMTSIINRLHGKPYRYWRIGTRAGDTHKSWWNEMREGGYVAIGWEKVGDLSGIRYDQASKDDLRERMRQHYYPDSLKAAGQNGSKLFNFTATMSIGDVVVAADGAKVLGIGKVEGGYEYIPELTWPHHRPVTWLSLESGELPETEGLLSAFSELDKIPNLLEIERRIRFASPVTLPPPPKAPLTPLTGIPGRVQHILERKRQVILYGPPGTGKTYWANRIARKLAALAHFHKPFEALDEAQKIVVTGSQAGEAGLVRTCTFHPSYGYEDFMEGYRPVNANGQAGFRLQEGIFKRLCQDAAAQPGSHFFLVIDEINRGDIPRIFGELITSLEKDKRHWPVLLPLSGEPFSVPDNVYIIGTMNTADRSIALLDTALRRRFGFLELMPDYTLLKSVLTGAALPLDLWLKALNQRIVASIGRDARNLQVGHAYFLENGQPVSDLASFARIVQDDILPLLEEYCYEDYDALEKILGSGLVDRAGQRLRHELFEPARQDELIQALIAPSPEITTSGSLSATPADTDMEEDEGDGDTEPGS